MVRLGTPDTQRSESGRVDEPPPQLVGDAALVTEHIRPLRGTLHSLTVTFRFDLGGAVLRDCSKRNERQQVAINFKLVRRVAQDPETSPWGRRWVGWDPNEPEESVWEVNRGVWFLGQRAEKESIATLSYEGTVRVVAEVAGRELIHYNHGTESRYALKGNVLPPGHPVRESLIGREVDHHRNPVTYFDSSEHKFGQSVRSIAARRAWLTLDRPQLRDAVSITARGGRSVTQLHLPPEFEAPDLRFGDRVFIVEVEDEAWRIAATAFVATNASNASESAASVSVALDAILNEGDELVVDDPEIAAALARSLDSMGTAVDPVAADDLSGKWRRHLEDLGWWGRISDVQPAIQRYARDFGTSSEPAPVTTLGKGTRTNSQAAFDALSTCYDGPTCLAMAEAYLRIAGLAPADYSISALPTTGRSNVSRRAFTISVGVTEVLFAELDPRSGQFLSWSVRVAPELAGSIARWLDIESQSASHGTYVTGHDPRDFFRSLFDEDDQQAIRAGSHELVVNGESYRRQDWHNPFLDAALHRASSSEA